jgi:hypothetical protein
VKLVYTLALGASAFGRESSSLSTCTLVKTDHYTTYIKPKARRNVMSDEKKVYPQFVRFPGTHPGLGGHPITSAVTHAVVDFPDRPIIIIKLDEVTRNYFKKKQREYPKRFNDRVKEIFSKMPPVETDDVFKCNDKNCFSDEYIERWLGPKMNKFEKVKEEEDG